MNNFVYFRGRKFNMYIISDQQYLIAQIEANTSLTQAEARDVVYIINANYDVFLKHGMSVNIGNQKIVCNNYFEDGSLVEIYNREVPLRAIVVTEENAEEVNIRDLNSGGYNRVYKSSLRLIAEADTDLAKAAYAFMNEVLRSGGKY